MYLPTEKKQYLYSYGHAYNHHGVSSSNEKTTPKSFHDATTLAENGCSISDLPVIFAKYCARLMLPILQYSTDKYR